MNDKERILSAVISNIIPGIMYNLPNREKYIESCILRTERIQPGDLVFAATTLHPNNYSVGFVHKVNEDCVTIRKIGSEKLCNYYNEGFYKINKDKLGYEILEGLQYKIYQKVLKAFRYTNYCTRFKAISFDGNKCTVQSRTMFKDDLLFEVSFDFDKKTTIAQIGDILEKADKESEVKTE